MDYGKRFKAYREKKGLTQIEAAEKIGIKNYQLGNYETNRSEPSLDVLKRMAAVYDVSVDSLLGYSRLTAKYELTHDYKTDYDDLVKALNEMLKRYGNNDE